MQNKSLILQLSLNHKMLPFSDFLKKLSCRAKTIKPWGCGGLSCYELGYFFIVDSQESAVYMRATAVAFTFFFALFPAIIFFFTLIPYLPIDNLHQQLLTDLQSLLPENTYQAAVNTINDLTQQRTGLLSFGFLFALYFATNGINALIDAFNQSIHVVETRGFIEQRFVSMFLLVVISLLVLIASLLIIFSEVVINYALSQGLLLSDTVILSALLLGKWIVSFLLLFTAISLLYYFGPVNSSNYKIMNIGAIFATVLSIIASLLFNYYVNQFGTYNKIYGSIGTVMVLMLWLQFNCLIILLGFDLNAKLYNVATARLSKPMTN